jgi:hypothetical protein
MLDQEFLQVLKVYLILDRLLFSELLAWFQETKSNEWKTSLVAERVSNAYGDLCLIQIQSRLIFGEIKWATAPTAAAAMVMESEDSQMEAIGSQNSQSTSTSLTPTDPVKVALEHLIEYFKSKFDCWMQPPLILAPLHRGPNFASKIIAEMGQKPSEIWNWRGFLEPGIQQELKNYANSDDDDEKLKNFPKLWSWYRSTFGPIKLHNLGLLKGSSQL